MIKEALEFKDQQSQKLVLVREVHECCNMETFNVKRKNEINFAEKEPSRASSSASGGKDDFIISVNEKSFRSPNSPKTPKSIETDPSKQSMNELFNKKNKQAAVPIKMNFQADISEVDETDFSDSHHQFHMKKTETSKQF